MSETKKEKAVRLLTEGRLTVREVGLPSYPGRIVASVRGDSGAIYMLGWDPGAEEWRCQCESRSECSHLLALKLVTVRERL